jgi:arginine N-succinyltransferase
VLTQTSKALGKTFRAEQLILCTDHEGASEVGGLFLHPGERAGGLGLLIARSRYLFIRQHRKRFGQRVIAELRGVIDESGGSPFWDAIAGKFFNMDFREADEFNAVHGTQFIADLMPKTPIYIAMLPDSARNVLGVPHPSGRAAMKMLEREGFRYDCYVDIFDGGPTMTANTDDIRTIREARELTLDHVVDTVEGEPLLLACGRLRDFAACYGPVITHPDGSASMDATSAALLRIGPGDRFLAMGR